VQLGEFAEHLTHLTPQAVPSKRASCSGPTTTFRSSTVHLHHDNGQVSGRVRGFRKGAQDEDAGNCGYGGDGARCGQHVGTDEQRLQDEPLRVVRSGTGAPRDNGTSLNSQHHQRTEGPELLRGTIPSVARCRRRSVVTQERPDSGHRVRSVNADFISSRCSGRVDQSAKILERLIHGTDQGMPTAVRHGFLQLIGRSTGPCPYRATLS
jgi:hypothetical protein